MKPVRSPPKPQQRQQLLQWQTKIRGTLATCAFFLIVLLASSVFSGASASEEQQLLQEVSSLLPYPLSSSSSATRTSSESESRLHWKAPSILAPLLLNATTTTLTATTLTRQLATGDFAALNAVFEGAVIDIPGNFETGAGPLGTFHVNTVQCRNLKIGDVQVDATSSQDITGVVPPTTLPLISALKVQVMDLQFDCTANYRWDRPLIGDATGSIGMESRTSDVLTDFVLESSQEQVQVTASTTDCQPNVKIEDMDFSTNSVLGKILNFVEGLIRGPVAEALENVVCNEMNSIGSETLPEILNQLTEGLDPYLQQLDQAVLNPLQPEQELQQARIASGEPNPYINFRTVNENNDASDLAHFVLDGLDELDSWLGSEINTQTNDDKELAINLLLREMILDDNGAFVWEMNNDAILKGLLTNSDVVEKTVKQAAAALGPGEGGEGMMLLESHDDLLQMAVTLDRISIYGLDSFTHFDTLQRIGNHTLQNKMGWQYLRATADITFRVTPSSLDSSMWSETKPGTQLLEKVHLTLRADDIEAVLSLFAAIHQDRMGSVPLGALFQSDAIATCLMSTLYPAQIVSGFSVHVANLVDPLIGGFASPGLDRVLTEVMDLMYNLYEHWLIIGLPNFAQTTIRDSVNELWMKTLNDLTDKEGEACPLLDLSVQDGKVPYVDFRDLLLPPDEAKAVGGSGQEPYGDVVSSAFELIDDQLLAVDQGDPNKRLILNSLLLDPITEEQSGTPGTVHFAPPLIDFQVDNRNRNRSASMMDEIAASLFDSMELQVSNATIRNINTIVEPTSVLKTSRDNPFLLQNLLQMGPIDGKPLNASVLIRLAVDPFDDDDAVQVDRRRLQTTNDTTIEHIMELSLSATGLRLGADVMAMMDAMQLQNFHLQDIFNLDCWLATIPAPALDAQGRIVQPQADGNPGGMQLESFLAHVLDLALDVQCINEDCSKAGLGVLTDLSKIWEESNVTTTMGERYEALATELLTGDYVQDQLARWLDAAPTKCPHNDEYNTRPTAYPPLPLPLFSSLSMDTMIFTALTGAEAGLLLMSEIDPSMLGLSSAEPGITTTQGHEDYIDFTSKNGIGSLADVVSYLFGQASDLLGVKEGSSGINGIVKDLLNDAGLLDLRFDGEPLYGDSSQGLRLNGIWVSGLDTFTQFDVLEAVGPQMLQNKIKLGRLSAEIDMSLVSGGNTQRVIISFGAEDIEASLPIYAAINSTTLDELKLGSLLEIGNILSCIFTAVEDVSIPSVDLSIGRVTDISVQGLLPATSEAFTRSTIQIQKLFNIGIDGMLNPVLRGVLNGVVSSWKNNAICTNLLASTPGRRRTQEVTSYIDFRDLFLSAQEALEYGGSGESPYGDLFRTILGFVDDLILDVDPDTQLAAVNDLLIAPLTKAASNVSGSVIMPGPLVDIVNRVNVGGLDATFTFRASDARIENLDTLRDPIALLAPVENEPYTLNNKAQMGLPGVRPLSLSLRILLGLEDDDDIDLRNDLRLTMDMQSVSAVLTAMLKVSEQEFGEFPLGDILNLDCWLAKMPHSPLNKYGFREAGEEPSASISDLAASVQQLSLRTKCFFCSSEGLEDWNTTGSQDIEAATDRVVNYVTSVLGGEFLQVQIDRALSNAARRCPHSPDYDPNFSTPKYATFESEHNESSTSFLLMLLIVTAALIMVLAVITLCVRCFVKVRHRRLLKSLPDRQLYLLQKEQEREDKRERELNAVTQSLFQSSASIPAVARYMMPLIILGNIGFFLSGHLSLGATVNIEVQLAGQSFRVEEFFSFSMAKSTIDIWNAGGRALAALIFIFSGLWPYTKQLITLVLWFMPPARCSMARRESILLWLDTLAKWSMVDIFVLLVSLAGFRVSIVSPDLDFLPNDLYQIDLLVIPLWGLYANMIAQIISQISSHFIIHYHRKVVAHSRRARRALFRKTAGFLPQDVEEAGEGFLDERGGGSSTTTSSESEDPENDVQKDKLCEHAYVRPHSNNSKLVARGYVSPMLITATVALSALLVAGTVLPSFQLEIMGILGVLVESGNGWNQAVENHSVFTMTEMLSDQAKFVGGFGNHLGLGTLSALLVLTVLIIPLVLTLALLYHWLAPMTKKTRRRMEVLLEALHAWQYVEVYLIATVVATWQLGPISEWMINSYCGSLDDTFDMLVYYGILSPKDAQCFKVEASIESAAYMLAASAILLAFLNAYIGNASRQYFRDTENKSKRGTQPSVNTEADRTASNQDDNISAVSGPGQSSAQPLALESRADKYESSSTGSSHAERQALVEYESNHFKDEIQENEGDVIPVATPASDEFSNNKNQEEIVYVDPLAPPTSTNEEVDENWQRSDAMEKIHPVPVLFTDKFRWTLRSQDVGRANADPLPVKGDPYFPIEVDPTSESNSFTRGESQSFMVAGELAGESQPLLMTGDVADSMPPTPAPSTLEDSIREGSTIAEVVEDEFTESGEKFGDDADTFRTDEMVKSVEKSTDDDEDTFTDEIVKVQDLEDEWESESEDDLFSRGETVDMSVSTSMDQSSNSQAGESVLIGSGNVLLEPTRQEEELFQDEDELQSVQTEDSDVLQQSTRVLQSALRDAEDSWRRGYSTAHSATADSGTHSGSTQPLSNTSSRRQGNSQLQAALMEDVEL